VFVAEFPLRKNKWQNPFNLCGSVDIIVILLIFNTLTLFIIYFFSRIQVLFIRDYWGGELKKSLFLYLELDIYKKVVYTYECRNLL
jgi:hypothetical protein